MRVLAMTLRKKLILLLSLCCISQIAAAQDIGLTKQFSNCMDKSNGVTSNMIDCFVAESKRQDIRLNKAYKELMNQLSSQRKKQLEIAQDAWITYRDENCDFYYDPEGGTIARVSANDCFVSATAVRAKELETLAGNSTSAETQPSPSAQNTPPAPSAPSAKNTAQNLTGPQKNAVRAAQSYLNISAFSRDGLIEQLSSQAGNGFNINDATKAVDSLNVDWNQEAVKSAKQYLQMMGFSCSGLIQQLSSRAGAKFTEKQATFGAQRAGAC
jgi:uncharacterized protein YecT (DUF1311 family)